MIYGMKPFNSAELRQYLDIINEDQVQEQDITEDEDLPGSKGEWRHGGHSVKYDPSSRTVHVKGRGGEHKHTFSKHPKQDAYRSRVQQIIDKLENDLTEAEQLRTFIALVS